MRIFKVPIFQNQQTLYYCHVLIFFYIDVFTNQNRGANKQDEAIELYGRAANLYKMAKKWSKAGQTFVNVANHHAKLGNKHDSATNFVDASNCFKKSDPKGE